MARITVIRPENDATEMVLSGWGHMVISAIYPDKNLKIIDLYGRKASREAVEVYSSGSDVILYFGHGAEDRLGADVPLLDILNARCLENSVVVAVSCHSARALGPEAIAQGARAFLGFDDILTVYFGQPSLFLQAFEEPLAQLILNETSAGDAQSQIRETFQQIEDLYRTNPEYSSHPDATIIWMAAHINRKNCVIEGDRWLTINSTGDNIREKK
ncbi:hypothetical protein [Litoreibacter halocynthiae]|uniref:hypothetical protein n=1 Tax=Litoreibacter halocynthiae TaxID=1242689 RepID=UPI002492047A|nr:hypothetical protein [Litoreibacter halocynthiae]